MPKIRLELHEVEIHRPKQRWNLYFVLATEHPTDEDKMVISMTPSQPIRVRRPDHNVLDLAPDGEGADGMILFEREMPADRSIRARIWVRHSRQMHRDVGKLLSNMKNELGEDAFEIVDAVAGLAKNANPWLIAAKSSVNLIGGILQKLPDRDMGFASMDEVFDDEFLNQGELDRKGGTGNIDAVWTWSVDE